MENAVVKKQEISETLNRWPLAIAAWLMILLTAVDKMIAVTIIPNIVRSIGGLELYPWISAGFMISFVVITPITGKWSDSYGLRKTSLIAMSLFVVGSLVCALSQSVYQLIGARIIQGMGSGSILTICYTIIGRIFQGNLRSTMHGVLGSVWAFGLVIGPLIGAFLVTQFDWRWAFYADVIAGLALIGVLWMVSPDHGGRRHPFDVSGTIIFTLFSTCLMIGLFGVAKCQWGAQQWLLLFLSLVFFVAFIVSQLRAHHPLIPLRLSTQYVIATVTLLGGIAGVCLVTTETLLSFYIQGVRGASVTTAGTMVMMLGAGWWLGSFLSGFAMNHYGARSAAVVGIGCFVIGYFLMSFVGSQQSLVYMGALVAVIGLGLGFLVNGTVVVGQAICPPSMIGQVTSVITLVRGLGIGLGMAVSGGLQLGIFRRSLLEIAEEVPGSTWVQILLQYPNQLLDVKARAYANADTVQKVLSAYEASILSVFGYASLFALLGLGLALKVPPLSSEQLERRRLTEDACQ